MTRTTDLIRHGLSAKLNQLLDGLYVQVNAGTVPLRQVLRAGHTFTEIFNSQNRSIRVMGVRLRSELDHFLQATYSPADIAAFKQVYGTNLSDWLTHRVLAKTAMSDETIPTEADVLRIRSLVRLWVSGEADREAITPRMQALGSALAKFRPMEPVRVYRNERKQGEDGWKEQYDFATAWSTDIYDAKVFGDVDRRLVTAIAQPEDILVSIPMVEGWCQVYDLGIVDAEKQDELVMVPHPSFEAERQEIPDEAALAALKVELREKVVDAWDERTGETPLPPNALAEAAKVLDRLPDEKVVALGEELGVQAPALKEASITDRACYWIAPSGLVEPAPEGHVRWCEDHTGKHYADSMRAFQPFFAEGWARAGAWAGVTYLHGRKLSQIHLEAMQRLVADNPVLRNETVLIDQTSPRIVWEVPFSDFTALNRLRDLRGVAMRRAKLASAHLNNTCPTCGAHQTCRCRRAHHAHFPGGEVPETHELCYECKQTTKQAAAPSPVLSRALKTVYESDDLYLALDPHGPFDGGCLIAAKAIIRAAGGGELIRLVSDHNGGQTEHYGAKVRGAIYDFLGGFSSPAAWIAALRQAEGWNTDDYRVVSGYDPDSDILDDPHAEKEVAKLLTGAMAGPAKQASTILPMVTPVFTTRALEALHRHGLMSKRVTQAVTANPAWAYNYAWGVLSARWPEGEAAIARSSERSVLYARSILKGRFPEAEATIAQDPRQAAIYANDTIKGRWPEGEAAISADPTWAKAYAHHVIQGRWPEGEAAIASDAKSAYLYARNTLKARWPEGEHAIAKDAEYAYRYATDVIDGRFLEAEGTIALVGQWAYEYALRALKSKWPLPHKALAERNIGMLEGLAWAQYKKLPEPAEGKTASPVPVPFALVDAIVARVEAFIVAAGPDAREVHIPLKDLMAQWSPTTSVHTFAVRWTLGDSRVSASGGVGPEAFAMHLTGLDEQSILTGFSDRVRHEIRHFVAHELAHVFQWDRVGHDHMTRNPLRNALGDDRCNYELKAISTEMCDTYGRGLRSNPNLSVEEFLTNDGRWKNLLRGITESERRRIIRDLYSLRRTSRGDVRRDAGLLRTDNDAAPRRASARKLTSRFLTSRTSAASMVLWHGGDLENPSDSDMSNKGGLRWEYGPGLYATTHYDTARKYAKGSRKLYRITLQQGSDANEHILPMDAVQAFVDQHMAARAKRDVLRDATRYTEKGLRAAWFINIIKHYNALPASKSGILRKFLVDQGVDYEIVDNAYGWNERMVVIFNMKKVTNIQRVMPKEKLEEFDLPTTFKESSCRSKFLQPKTSMVVFHGTPHDFEQFKTDRIGIGEGNQVYGYGLYFTDTYAVADYYRDSLSNASDVSAFIWQGKDYKAKSGPESHAISLAFFSGIPTSRRIAKEGLADAKAGEPYALEMGGEAYWSKMLEVANAIKSKREIKIRRGLIYEVDIPDDGRYLLWDSPLAAQPPAVAAALAKTDASLWRPGLKNPAIGGDFYRELKNSFLDKHPTNAEASKAASLYLLGLGIVGIKYLDADSRKAKHGSFNYVVFDDRFVKVVKKASQMTPDEARLDWLARHKVPVVGGRVVLYHATPQTTAPLIRAEGLRAGSLLALQPEKAVFQARRDRGLAAHEVVCFEVSIPVENLRCGMWASTANPVPPSSLREVSFDLKLAKFLQPKTARPIPIPPAVVSEVTTVIEVLVANGGGSAPLPEGSWPPLSLVRTVTVRPPVVAPGRPYVSNAAIALKTRRIIIEVTGDLASDPTFLSNDIAQAVCHELAHAYQAHQQGVDQFLKNRNRDKLMSPKVNQEVKAMATELCMSYTALLTHDPSLSVEDFLHDDWRWDQIRDAASPRGIQRILRDLYQVRAAGAPGQRHAGVLPLNASRTSRVSKFLQPKTAGPAIDLQPLMREFMTALDPEGKFPLPTIKYVSRSGVEWLGICYSRHVNHAGGLLTGAESEILIQKGIAVDPKHLRSVVAHEVTHHVAVNEQVVGQPADKLSEILAPLSDAHGSHWLRVVERINAIYGANFVTQTSDMDSITWEAKKVFLFIVEHPSTEAVFYSWSPSVTQKSVDRLLEQRSNGCRVYITTTTNRFLVRPPAKSPMWTFAATKAEQEAVRTTIQELQDTGANLFSTYASGVTKTRSTDNKPWTLVMATPKRNATSSWINAWAKTPGLTTGEAVDLGMVQRDGREVRTVKLRGEGDLLAALPKFNLHSILNLPGIASDRVMADDVQAQLRTYWESAATPKASKFLQPKQAQVVFHGSPHDFDQFSLDHFSKGEGASAYGYGLYFTSNEAVADYYKRTLSLGNMTIEGKPFKPRREIIEILGAHRENLPAAAEALKAFVKSGEYHNRYGHLTQARKAIKAIKDGTLDLGDNAGHLYAAQIPDDGSYLLWDEPLQNQPPKVKAAIKKIIPTLNRKDYGDFTPDMPVGFNLLYAVMKAQGKSGPGFGGRETSMLLRSYGILGVKYLDQESRGAEAGQSYNYVVYDDADVRVVRKTAGMQDGERSDSRQLGKPLTQDPRIVERKIEYVKLYRAVAAGTDKFHDMDYCTLNKDFAIGHAEHGAAVDEEPYWVLEGVFPVGWIYEAYNPGEYFFHRKDGGSSRGKRIHVAEPEQ